MSDSTGTPGTPSFSSQKEYGSTTLTVKNIDGINRVVSDQKVPTYMVKGPSLGTFVPQAVKLEPPKNYAAKPMIDGIQKGPTRVEYEALRTQNNLHTTITSVALEIKDLMHIAEELAEKHLKPETLERLEKAQEEASGAFAEAFQDPTEDKVKVLEDSKREFTEAVQEAEREASSLPPEKTEADKKAELQQEILSLSIDIDSTLKEAVRLESQIQDDAIKQSFAVETAKIELALTDLKKTPDETAKEKLETDFEEYKNNITQIQQLIAQQPKAASSPDEEKEVLKYVVSISTQVSDLIHEAKDLENNISDAARLQDFKDKTEDLEARYASLRQNLDVAGKNYFALLLTHYAQEIQSVKNFILANPKPAAPPAATPAATAGPAAAPAAPISLNIYAAWPSSSEVFFRKGNRTQAEGWFLKSDPNHPIEADEGREWETQQNRFREIYKKFFQFANNIRPTERDLIKPLIDSKDTVIALAVSRNLAGTIAANEDFERDLDIWKIRFESFKKLKAFEDALSKLDHRTQRVSLDNQNALKREREVAHSELAAAFEHVKDQDIKVEEFDTLINVWEAYRKKLEKIEEVEKRIKEEKEAREKHEKEVYEKVHGVHSPKTQFEDSKLVALPQEIPKDTNKMSQEEKDRMIKPVGRPAMRMEEYVKEQEAKRREVDTMVVTDELDDEWPELRNHHKVGERIDKNWFKRFEIKTTYERMFNRDKDGFLSRYTNPVLDPATNGIRYVESNLLKAQNREWRDDSGRLIPGTYEIIKEILEGHGITVERQNEEERKAEDSKKYEERQTMRAKYSMTHHPYLKKEKGLFRKEDTGDRLGYWSTEKMTRPSVNLDTVADRYEKFKRERQKYLNHPANYRFGDMEQDLDVQLAEARKEKQAGPKNVFKRDLFGGELRKFEKMLEKYEKEAGSLIQKQKEERKLPQDPLERAKRAKSNERIAQITSKRLENLEKKTNGLNPRTKWALMLAPVVPALAFAAYQKFSQGKGVATERASEPPKISAPADTQGKEKGWEYAVYEKYKMTDTSQQMSPEGGALDYRPLLELVKGGTSGTMLVEKFVPSVVTKDKPNSAQDLLAKDAHRMYTEKGCYGLAEKQQEEICRLIEAFVNIGQAVGAPNREKGLYVESVMIHQGETLGTYMQRITDMVQKAKK